MRNIYIYKYIVLYYVHLVTEVTTPIECPEIIWGLRMKGENYVNHWKVNAVIQELLYTLRI